MTQMEVYRRIPLDTAMLHDQGCLICWLSCVTCLCVLLLMSEIALLSVIAAYILCI